MKALLIKTDGTEMEVSPKDGKDFSLQEMYDLIGCTTVEHVALGGQEEGTEVDMWCDEEGLMFDDFVVNKKATEYYRKAYAQVPAEELAIVGNALVVDKTTAQEFFN